MLIVVGRVELRIPAHSLKEKRRALRSLIDKGRSRFDVRIAEVDGQDTWQRAVVGYAVVGSQRAVLEGISEKVMSFIVESGAGEVVDAVSETLVFSDLSLAEGDS